MAIGEGYHWYVVQAQKEGFTGCPFCRCTGECKTGRGWVAPPTDVAPPERTVTYSSEAGPWPR